jgi:hypothetical protein
VAERFKAAVLKTAERKLRGFESLLLRKADNRIARSSFFLVRLGRKLSLIVRLAPTCGVAQSKRREQNGEMAEWLKAPVC